MKQSHVVITWKYINMAVGTIMKTAEGGSESSGW